jgi:hypothetical protein
MIGNPFEKHRSSDRRFFIKKSLLGASSLLLAQFLPLGCSGTPSSFEAYDDADFFSDDETYLLSLITKRIIPLDDGNEHDLHDVLIRLDRFFVDAFPEDQKEFRRLLIVFNNPIFIFIFSGSVRSFDRMPDAERDDYLRGWMTSRWGFRRTAFQALKRLIMSMHYTRDETWEKIGYGGPLV